MMSVAHQLCFCGWQGRGDSHGVLVRSSRCSMLCSAGKLTACVLCGMLKKGVSSAYLGSMYGHEAATLPYVCWQPTSGICSARTL